MRIRLAVAFIAVGLGALAAGILVSRGGASQNGLEKGPPGVVATGHFRSLGWATTGTAVVVRGDSGLVLRLRDFRTQKAPELYVYVSRRRVAPLRRAWGAQAYALPTGALQSLRSSVRIFCAKCNRTFGAARLAPARSA